MTTYDARTIESTIRSAAAIRIAKKNYGNEYKGDAGYWDGGRCEYGGAHNLQEDCQTLAKFFNDISDLKNARKELTKFNNEQEFNKSKQELINKANKSINGLQMGSGGTTSIGGVCIIWDDFKTQLDQIIDGFRREVENLKGDIERVAYNEAKELQKLNQEERKLQKEIEENERKARSENDPEKQKKFMLIVEDAKNKWKKVLERKKRLKSSTLGDNFNPDKHVNDFIQGIKNNLENKQKKSPRNPKSPDSPNNPDDSKYNPVNPLDPFQSTSTASPNWLQKNKTLIILAGIALLLILYFSSQSAPQPTKSPSFYDHDF